MKHVACNKGYVSRCRTSCWDCGRSPTSNGYTLIEMLLAISIFSILTTTVAINFRVVRQNQEFTSAAENLVGAIREVQNMSQTGRTVKLCGSGAQKGKICASDNDCAKQEEQKVQCVEAVPSGGYGLHFNKSEDRKFIIFADSIPETDIKEFNPLEKIYERGVGDRVSVSALSVRGSSLEAFESVDDMDLVFEPPKPRTWINTEAGVANITLQHNLTKNTRMIVIDSASGRVGIE